MGEKKDVAWPYFHSNTHPLSVETGGTEETTTHTHTHAKKKNAPTRRVIVWPGKCQKSWTTSPAVKSVYKVSSFERRSPDITGRGIIDGRAQ